MILTIHDAAYASLTAVGPVARKDGPTACQERKHA